MKTIPTLKEIEDSIRILLANDILILHKENGKVFYKVNKEKAKEYEEDRIKFWKSFSKLN